MTLVLAVMLAMPMALAPHAASAGIFDFLFGGGGSDTGATPRATAGQQADKDPGTPSRHEASAFHCGGPCRSRDRTWT